MPGACALRSADAWGSERNTRCDGAQPRMLCFERTCVDRVKHHSYLDRCQFSAVECGIVKEASYRIQSPESNKGCGYLWSPRLSAAMGAPSYPPEVCLRCAVPGQERFDALGMGDRV